MDLLGALQCCHLLVASKGGKLPEIRDLEKPPIL